MTAPTTTSIPIDYRDVDFTDLTGSPLYNPDLAPVSPMKILAGAAFHHRNPATAPIAPAATIATSSAGPTRMS